MAWKIESKHQPDGNIYYMIYIIEELWSKFGKYGQQMTFSSMSGSIWKIASFCRLNPSTAIAHLPFGYFKFCIINQVKCILMKWTQNNPALF